MLTAWDVQEAQRLIERAAYAAVRECPQGCNAWLADARPGLYAAIMTAESGMSWAYEAENMPWLREACDEYLKACRAGFAAFREASPAPPVCEASGGASQ